MNRGGKADEVQQHSDEYYDDQNGQDPEVDGADSGNKADGSEEKVVEKKGVSIFVGNLPFGASVNDVKELFESSGDVLDVRIFMTSFGKSKGSALVTFSTNEQAQAAIKEHDQQEMQGRKLFIREDRPQDKPKRAFVQHPRPMRNDYQGPNGRKPYASRSLGNQIRLEKPAESQVFIGNLPFQTTWQDLKELCAPFGEIVRADILRDHRGYSKGSGTVVFATTEAAAAAIAQLDKTDYRGRQVVAHIDTHAGCKIFIGNLPYSTTWQELKDLFSKFGQVVRADVEKFKGYGTLSFSNRNEAETAIAEMNGYTLDGRAIVVRHDQFAYTI